jgi:hypothetical protein
MEELQKIKDFIKELIDEKNQKGGDEEWEYSATRKL